MASSRMNRRKFLGWSAAGVTSLAGGGVHRRAHAVLRRSLVQLDGPLWGDGHVIAAGRQERRALLEVVARGGFPDAHLGRGVEALSQ